MYFCAWLLLPPLLAVPGAALSAGSAVIANPERGFYGGPLNLMGGVVFASEMASDDMSLYYGVVMLDDYVDGTPISAGDLTLLGDNLGVVKDAGKKVIFRVVYDNSAAGNDPEDVATVADGHLGQLAPVIEAHKGVIAVVQAGIIGAWGEWHSSAWGHDDNSTTRARVVNALHRHLPAWPCLQIQVRRPDYMLEIAGPAGVASAPPERGECELAHRLAHHNDCWLASSTDMGTYQPAWAATRAAALEAVRGFTAHAVYGGETCAVSEPLTGCPNALTEAEQLRATFVNSHYHPEVLGNWSRGGCLGDFSRSLGYRLHASAVRASGAACGLAGLAASPSARPASFAFEVDVANTGWAAPLSHRPASSLLLLDLDTFLGPAATVDGNTTDWRSARGAALGGKAALATDPAGDAGTTSAFDAASIHAMDDARTLFVLVTAHVSSLGPGGLGSSGRLHLLIDTDGNAGTGWAGSEFVVEGSTLYANTGGSFNGGGAVAGAVLASAASADGLSLELSFDRLALGPGAAAVFPASGAVRFAVTAADSSWAVSDRLPDAGWATHTFRTAADSAAAAFPAVLARYALNDTAKGVVADPRAWLPGATATLTAHGVLPAAALASASPALSPTAVLAWALHLPDGDESLAASGRYALRLANADGDVAFEAASGYNILDVGAISCDGDDDGDNAGLDDDSNDNDDDDDSDADMDHLVRVAIGAVALVAVVGAAAAWFHFRRPHHTVVGSSEPKACPKEVEMQRAVSDGSLGSAVHGYMQKCGQL